MKEIDVQDLNVKIKEQQEFEKKVGESIGRNTTGLLDGMVGVFPRKLQEKFTSTEIYDDLHGGLGVEVNGQEALIDRTFVNSDDDYIIPTGDGKRVEKVLDRNNLAAYKKKMVTAADMIDKMADTSITDNDEASLTAKEFIKTTSSKLLRRAATGCNNPYIGLKNPLGFGGESIIPTIGMSIEGNKLQNNIKKYQHKFPIHQMLIDSENQLQTFSDYWKEKEKAGGVLSSAKEKAYRQMLYDQTVVIAAQYNKVINFVTKKENCEALHNDEVIDKKNDPWHIHPKSIRGTSPFNTGLTATKVGLENGWAVDDIGMLAAFYDVYYKIDNRTKNNGHLEFDKFVEYDKPDYGTTDPVKAAEKKAYIEKLGNHWKKIENTKLTSKEDRKKLLDESEELIQEGIKNKYLTKVDNGMDVPLPEVKYYLQTAKQRPLRDKLIESGKEPGFYAGKDNIITENRSRIDLIMRDLNAKRTDLRLSNENEDHKNVRLALEDLKKFNKKPVPDNNADKEKLSDYAEEYLAKLDAVQHYSKIYQKARSGASSSGGKKRLSGAVEADRYAEREKQALLERFKEAGLARPEETIDDLRSSLAIRKMNKRINKINSINKMPETEKGKNNLKSFTADILVGRLIMVKGSNGYKVAGSMGTEVIKDKIMKDKDFNNLFNSYIKEGKMTPQNYTKELMGDGVVNRLKEINAKLKKTSKEMTAEEAKKKAAKQAADNKKLAAVKAPN